MNKTYYDAKSDLKPPQASVQRSLPLFPELKPDILPFLNEPTKATLKEILNDLSFLTGKDNLDPIDLYEMFVHYWIHEIARTPRMVVARRLHAARRFSYKREKLLKASKSKDYEDTADRLLEALKA
tara:strand:- start:184 stop:561 length:378 start_codon:yes stop_codon:yes gene_type:complete